MLGLSADRTARTAGLVYLVVVVSGLFGLLYVPGRLPVTDDPAETASRILAAQGLFTAQLVTGLIGTVAFLFAVLLLYRLLEGVNRQQAAVMVILLAVQVPLGILGVQNHITALDVLRGDGVLSAVDPAQRALLASHPGAAPETALRIATPALLGQLALTLWLLIRGAPERRLPHV